MSKHRSKRKGLEVVGDSEALILANLNLPLDLTQQPSFVACTLLACLPKDASSEPRNGKLSLEPWIWPRPSFSIRQTEPPSNIKKRALNSCTFLPRPGRLARRCLSFYSWFLAEEWSCSLSFLCLRSWLSDSRLPQLWYTLDTENGLIAKARKQISNMDHLLKLLNRPQFALLKTLVPPHKVRLKKQATKRIAESCPQIEKIDVGYSTWSHMHVNDNDLLLLPSAFPHLSKIHVGIDRDLTRFELHHFFNTMANRLVDLRICICVYVSTNQGFVFSNDDLTQLGCHCPNFTHFHYSYDRSYPELFTAQGLIVLLCNCCKLKSLELLQTKNLGLEPLNTSWLRTRTAASVICSLMVTPIWRKTSPYAAVSVIRLSILKWLVHKNTISES